MRGAVFEVDATETETGVDGIQRGDVPGVFRDAHITLHTGLQTSADLPDRRLDRGFGLLAECVEALVEQRDELLFVPQFLG
ncbi:hypothetical protein AB0M39_00530 [Streptomyces sp. NPDC051907]|uniref:hypothetical protein n=1 Tax=Streptomyces sp. NPDC051907 TaxID=3155284 RepID=UPI0034269F2B